MALEQRIESLKRKHDQLKKIIHEKEVCHDSNDLDLHHLKAVKLDLKDQIEGLMHGSRRATA